MTVPCRRDHTQDVTAQHYTAMNGAERLPFKFYFETFIRYICVQNILVLMCVGCAPIYTNKNINISSTPKKKFGPLFYKRPHYYKHCIEIKSGFGATEKKTKNICTVPQETQRPLFSQKTLYTWHKQQLISRFNTDDAFLHHVDPDGRGEVATRPGNQRQGELEGSAGACWQTVVLHFSYWWGNLKAHSWKHNKGQWYLFIERLPCSYVVFRVPGTRD